MLKVMAEVKMTWLDYIKGRFHGVVFYNRKGRTYLRKAPGEYKPATVWQKRQRNRLREVSVFYSIIRQTCLKQIWAKAAEGMSMSGMNLFVKMNIGAFSGIDQWRDYEKLHFSYGNLPCADDLEAVCTPDKRKVVFTWDVRLPLKEERQSDKVMAVLVFENEEFRVFSSAELPYRRADKRAELVLEEGSPEPKYVYCFFMTENGREFSHDVCCKL